MRHVCKRLLLIGKGLLEFKTSLNSFVYVYNLFSLKGKPGKDKTKKVD